MKKRHKKKRDRQWLEALHPGSTDTLLAKEYNTPKKYGRFARETEQLDREMHKFVHLQVRRQGARIKKLTAQIDLLETIAKTIQQTQDELKPTPGAKDDGC